MIGGKGNASASLPSSREALQDGNAQPITFTFSETGAVSLRAFVVPSDSYFKKWGPSDIPTGIRASPQPSNSTSATPSGAARGTPGEHLAQPRPRRGLRSVSGVEARRGTLGRRSLSKPS